MKKIFKIARHEFRLTTRSKAYKIITVIGPFLIIAVSVLPSLLSSRAAGTKKETSIAVTSGGSGGQVLFNTLRPALEQARVIPFYCENEEECLELVRTGKAQGYLVLPEDFLSGENIGYYSLTATDIVLSEMLKTIVGQAIVSLRLAEAGLDPEQVAGLSRMPGITVRKINREGTEERSQDFLSIMLTAIAFIMLLYMTVLLYGQMIGRSIVMEKTSKTVELMLSSVKPGELMYGKIFGLGFAGILQYAIWIGVAAILIKIIGPVFSINLPASFTGATLGFLALFFILAFLYASAFAALGAAAEDEQHVGQLAWPLMLCLALPLMLISPLIMNPESTVVRVMSLIPLTAPMVMFTRTLINIPPWWEILLCVAILAGTIALFTGGAAKIFRTGILMTGKRFTLKEIFKWLKY